MKRKCIYCSKNYEVEDGGIIDCPYCGKDNDTSKITVKGVHELHQNAHNNITKYSNTKNTGMVFLVVGIILLIIGCLFIALSFKFNQSTNSRVFRPNSVEFIFCILALSCSVISLTLSIIKLTISYKKIKFYRNIIASTKIK